MNFNRSRRRVTKWNLVFHAYSIFFGICSGFVMVPLYLKFIPTDLYGSWLAAGNVLMWLMLVDPGIGTVLQQRVAAAYGKRDIHELNSLLTGGTLYAGIASLGVLAVGLAASDFLFGFMNLPEDVNVTLLQKSFLAAVFGNAVIIFSCGVTSFNIGMQSSLGPGFVFVFATIGSLTLTVVLLYRGIGLYALPIGTIFMGFVLTLGNYCCLSWRFRQENIRYEFSMNGIARLAKLSGYSFLAKSGNALCTNMDAFVLARYMGPETTATFVLTRKVADILRVFPERIAVAFQPAISHVVGSGQIEKVNPVLLRLLQLILWFLGLVVAGLIVFNSHFVTLWVGSQFYAGWQVNTVLAISLIGTVFVNTLSSLCFALGNIKSNSVAILAQGLLAGLLTWIGGKFGGLLGVALAPLMSILAVSLWYYPKAFALQIQLKYTQIRMMAHQAGAVTVSAILSCGGFHWIAPETWGQFCASVLIFGGFYFICLSFLSRQFREEVIMMFKHTKLLLYLIIGIILQKIR